MDVVLTARLFGLKISSSNSQVVLINDYNNLLYILSLSSPRLWKAQMRMRVSCLGNIWTVSFT